MTWFSGLVAAFASLWCIASWLTAPHHDAINVPLLMVLGEIMVVISMTPLRAAAYANLIIGTGPITLALALWGDNMERVIALAIAATATFLIGMLRHQHGEAVQRLLLEQRLASLAHSDALTGIANRRGLEAAFARLAAQHTKPALILIDLDKFKPINDRHGHEVGDMVLVKVAARLRAAVVDDGTVCRLGGDEFAVLLGAYASRPPERVAGAILSALSRPVVIAGNPLTIGASLGIACCNGDENLAQLLARADAAMYRAKRGEVEGARPVQPVRKAWVMG